MKKRRFHSSAEARSCLLSYASISHTHSFSPRCGFKFQFGVTQSSSYNNVFYHISFRCLQVGCCLQRHVISAVIKGGVRVGVSAPL